MGMKQYLVETFAFNDAANIGMLEKIKQLTDKTEAIRYFSHLINSQNKWLKRLEMFPAAPQMDWWDPIYELGELHLLWKSSMDGWIEYLQTKSESELFSEVKFVGFDGAHWSVMLKDIALQLNYHSIHHRAQIQIILRQQGIEPDFIDYIGTKYKRLG